MRLYAWVLMKSIHIQEVTNDLSQPQVMSCHTRLKWGMVSFDYI
jgi:hypothetical protein